MAEFVQMRTFNEIPDSSVIHTISEYFLMNRVICFSVWLILLGGFSSQFVWAGCSPNPASTTVSTNATNIVVPRDATPGTAIGPVFGSYGGKQASLNCTYVPYLFLVFTTPLVSSNLDNIYETGVPGIGVKVWSDFGKITYVGNTPTYWYQSNTANASAWITGINFQLYVTGQVKPGTLSFPAPFIQAMTSSSSSNSAADGVVYNYMSINTPITLSAQSCETPDITVSMGKHNRNEFSGVGSSSSATLFNFKLNGCPAGLNSVNYTFMPATSLIGTGDGQYITLDGSSDASGVGIQVLYDNNTPVPFNTKIKFDTYNPSSGGDFSIPMKARYVQIGNIQPGEANSSITFEMSYE